MQRFKCGNPACSQRTFSERVEALAATGRRRTTRLAEALRALGYALGGQAAARLAARLGMHISGPVLRELRRAGCAPSPVDCTVIGIDDWALARGHRYGTIVVDLQRRRPIELLAERDGATVKAWLNTQPHIEIVARDRGVAYAEAVRTVIPDVQQVADRWHLLANLRDAVERLLMRCTSKLREAAQQQWQRQASEGSSVEAVLPPVVPAEPVLSAAQRHSKVRRQHRLERYQEVIRRHGNGESIRAIGLVMDIDRRTVRGFLRARSFPEQARRGPRASLLDAHEAHLEARIAASCRNAMPVWRELRARGFTGRRSIARAAFVQLQVAGGDRQLDVRRTSAPSARRACAWVLGWQ